MSAGGKRLTIDIAITGSSQQADLPPNLGRVNQVILTSDKSGQTLKFSISNEKGDTLFGPREIALPENEIRPELLPIGVLTLKIEEPVPVSGTVTAVVLTEG